MNIEDNKNIWNIEFVGGGREPSSQLEASTMNILKLLYAE